jgi:Fe-S oxidoreductase
MVPGLDAFTRETVGPIAGELGRFGRQVSGYSLEHLLPERGGHLARALVGTEGTCGLVLGATVSLTPLPSATALAVLGYQDIATAAEAVPDLLVHHPLALEGIDARMVDIVRRHRSAAAVPELPAGSAWLFAEVGGTDGAEALANAEKLARAGDALGTMVSPSGPVAARLWAIREDGAGLGGRTPAGEPAWPGWEDAAVPPALLGPYLRDFEQLMQQHAIDGLLYGHFGDGCVHVRLDLPVADHSRRLREFLTEAATLVAGYGGSLSGEHGDGRARSELLPVMYSPAAIAAFAGFKRLFDPDGLLNPGVLVEPDPVDTHLRLAAAKPLRTIGGFALHADHGDLTTAVHRCVGVGKCRADTGGFMCPSYLATQDEKDSTRGRARVLQELANGSLVKDGWRAPEIHEALDLCLACKACARDCPASVDMATYKAEVLHQAYRRRLRPASHYALGWLPRWTALASRAPKLANRLTRLPGAATVTKRLAGIDQRRDLPAFAPRALDDSALRRHAQRPGAPRPAVRPHHTQVVVWADTFTRAFTPPVAERAVALLAEAGFEIVVPTESACCGLTWISTGQLDAARRRLRETLDVLAPYAEAGMTIVGLEPSCTAVLRSDLVELLPGDSCGAPVAAATRTLAETIVAHVPDLSFLAGRLEGRRLVAQPHCHQYAVMGYEADLQLLEAAGAEVTTLSGCCGLAGNFGMEAGHYDVSVAVAEHALLPALRDAPDGATLLADGFSCRTQAAQLADWPAAHLAELLAP